MAKTNTLKKVALADWLAQQRNPEFNWAGHFRHQRLKDEKRELRKELAYWLKATLSRGISMLLQPVIMAVCLVMLIQGVMGWSTEITVLIVTFAVVATSISSVKEFVYMLDKLNSATYRYFDVCASLKMHKK